MATTNDIGDISECGECRQATKDDASVLMIVLVEHLLRIALFRLLVLLPLLYFQVATKGRWSWRDGTAARNLIAVHIMFPTLEGRVRTVGLGHEDRCVCGPFSDSGCGPVLVLLGQRINGGSDKDVEVIRSEATSNQGGSKGFVLPGSSKLRKISLLLESLLGTSTKSS